MHERTPFHPSWEVVLFLPGWGLGAQTGWREPRRVPWKLRVQPGEMVGLEGRGRGERWSSRREITHLPVPGDLKNTSVLHF